MPNWKKVAVSGSAVSFSSLSVDTSITASVISGSQLTGSLFGTASQAISSSYALSSSYAPGSGTSVSASYASTASYVNLLYQDVFITGTLSVDGDIRITNVGRFYGSASYAISSSYTVSSSYTLNSTSASYALSSSYAVSSSKAISSSYAATASHAEVFTIGGSQMMYSNVPSTTAGNNSIFATNTGSFAGAFYQYTLYSGSNARSENATAVWTAVTSSYTNYSTIDVGDTSGVVGSVVIVGGQIQLNLLTPTAGWTVRAVATFV